MSSAVDRWDDVLGTVGVRVDVMELDDGPPGWPDRDNAAVRSALREFQQVRNVIVHRGGIVDSKLQQFDRFGRFREGEELDLSHDLVVSYGHAVIDYASACGGGAIVRLA